jgi:hypothetical protein
MFRKAVIAILLASTILVATGCYGTFSLTRKMYSWNGTFDDKFVQSAVMWVFLIIPVYEVCGFIDLLALNTIEFWTGSNPVALTADKETRKEITADGKSYKVRMGNDRMMITQTSGIGKGKSVELYLDRESMSWKLSDGTKSITLASFSPAPENKVSLYYPDGRVVTENLMQPEVAIK